jgi:hypothetical protein
MEATTEDKAAQVKRRRWQRVNAFSLIFLMSVFLAAATWLNAQTYRQCRPVAAQYEQDCLKPASASPDCRVLTLQVVYEQPMTADPDDGGHWKTFQSQSGQKLEADVSYPSVGDTVSGTVWNGELEEVTDGGETRKTESNPIQQAQSACVVMVGTCLVSLIWLCFLPKMFRAA